MCKVKSRIFLHKKSTFWKMFALKKDEVNRLVKFGIQYVQHFPTNYQQCV